MTNLRRTNPGGHVFWGTDMQTRGTDHWNDHARRWEHFGAPLRPLPVDVAVAEELAQRHARSIVDEMLSAVLLGVTPELAAMQWPERTRLLGLDRCPEMIAGLWPLDSVPTEAKAVQGDWNAIPCDAGSVDLVVGDGCYVLLPYPEIYDGVSAEVARVLKPDGRFSIRVFVRPEKPESPEDVMCDLQEGLIGSFHAFKWRLAMSLHGTLDEGVRVGDVWSYWNARKIGETILSDRFGWSVGSIQTINAYRDIDTRYHYPTMMEIREHFSGYFEEVSCHLFDYELGDRCPTFVLKPR